MAWESSPSSHDPALPEAAADLAALAFLREDRLVGEGVEGQVGALGLWGGRGGHRNPTTASPKESCRQRSGRVGHWDTGTL